MIWVNVIAILLSPVVALLISVWVQNRKEKRGQKLWIFNTLIATRHNPIIDENVRALNMIDVAYSDCRHVRDLWHQYYDMLCNEGLNNEVGGNQRQKKNLELITEMAMVVGYKQSISHLDVARVYYPTGLGEQSKASRDIADELLRVLKASGGVQFIRQDKSPARATSSKQDT